MPFRVVMRLLYGRVVLKQRSVPLVRLSALEPKPIIEALARRPTVEGATRAKFVVRCVVPLAKRSRAVLIGLENLRDAGCFPRPLPVVTRETGSQLCNASGVH